MNLNRLTLVIAAGLQIYGQAARAAEFVYDEKINQGMAKKLGIPVFFTVPASSRAPLPKSIDTTDRLIDFRHPDGKGSVANVGLRLVVAKRDGFARRMAKSGLIHTGDILLSFRPEWGGGGAYPSIQMGVSHTGMAYMRDGEIRQIDNPLNAEYNGKNLRGDFNNAHYNDLKFMHVIRPRDLTKAQKANIESWARRFADNGGRLYPRDFEFTQDYNSPKYKSGMPLTFVKELGQIGLLQSHPNHLAIYCSEFVWSLLALRKCDPAKTADDFKSKNVPACVDPIMTPLQVTGDYPLHQRTNDNIGLSDGPLVVISALKRPQAETDALIDSVFTENAASVAKMSTGHRELAKQLEPEFAPLKKYYQYVAAGGLKKLLAGWTASGFRARVPDNYSPTSFLIDTLLPQANKKREMDYVATVAFE